MKTTTSILTWINRLMMIAFSVLLTFCLFGNEDQSIAYMFAYIFAFFLGIFQVISFIIAFVISLYDNELNTLTKQLIGIYFLVVVFYFLYVAVQNSEDALMIALPILLSYFWTYILEVFNKEL
ncbi:MAG: hypothetical protein ACPGSD_18025 [Flavobacteriales bacterium]